MSRGWDFGETESVGSSSVLIEFLHLESELLRLVAEELTELVRGEHIDVLAILGSELTTTAVFSMMNCNIGTGSLVLVPVNVVGSDLAASDSLTA